MNKKKQLAACLVFSLGLTWSAPVWAADTTASSTDTTAVSTAQTKGTAVSPTKPNTLTLQEIQTLAVQKNPNAQKASLSLKLAENSLAMAGNDLRSAESSVQGLSYESGDNSEAQAQIAALQQQIKAIQASNANWQSDATDSAAIALLNAQIANLQASLGSASSSMQSSFEALLAQRQSAESKVDSAENAKKDAEHSKDELAVQMRYTTAQLVTKEQQLEQSAALLQKQYTLAIKQQELAELQKELGLSTALDATNSYLSAAQIAAQLNQTQDSLISVKRAINVMIGRTANAELNIAPVELSNAITTAPTYNEQLVQTIKTKNYALKTLQRDINNYHEQAEDLRAVGSTASDKYEALDYQIALKRLEVKNAETDLADTVKAAIDEVKTTGESYKNTQLAYSAAQTTYEQSKLRYDLGMIAALELQGAEVTLQKAEADNNAAAYNHYLANMKYQAITQGVAVQ